MAAKIFREMSSTASLLNLRQLDPLWLEEDGVCERLLQFDGVGRESVGLALDRPRARSRCWNRWLGRS